MSTNKTPNYQLHSWMPDDEFHVSEINENFTKLDAAVKSEAQTAAAVRSSLAGQIAQKAEIAVGSYVGIGPQELHINLGRKPAMIHIEKDDGDRSEYFTYGGLFTGNSDPAYGVAVDDTGFSIIANTSVNGQGTKYCYIAYFV